MNKLAHLIMYWGCIFSFMLLAALWPVASEHALWFGAVVKAGTAATALVTAATALYHAVEAFKCRS